MGKVRGGRHGPARRVLGSDQAREIGEGLRKGANGRRQKYAGVFLQIFATVVPYGMPRQLQTLAWRVWDLR